MLELAKNEMKLVPINQSEAAVNIPNLEFCDNCRLVRTSMFDTKNK